MRATNAMTQRAEFLEYAGLATEAGYPSEVVALIARAEQRRDPAQRHPFRRHSGIADPRAASDAAAVAADAAKPATLSNPRAARATADALVGSGDMQGNSALRGGAGGKPGDPLIQYRLGVAQALAGRPTRLSRGCQVRATPATGTIVDRPRQGRGGSGQLSSDHVENEGAAFDRERRPSFAQRLFAVSLDRDPGQLFGRADRQRCLDAGRIRADVRWAVKND